MDRWRAKFHSPQPAIALPTNGINNRKSERALILVTWIWFPSLSQVLATRMFFFRNNKGSAPSARQDIRQSRIGESIVQAEQIFTVDKSRVLKFLGHLTPEEMSRVDDAVRASLALNPIPAIEAKL